MNDNIIDNGTINRDSIVEATHLLARFRSLFHQSEAESEQKCHPSFIRAEMEYYLNRILDNNINKINQLKIIHIAGTKGKGSSAAFTESILRFHGYKTGLFTSPHLMKITGKFLSSSSSSLF